MLSPQGFHVAHVCVQLAADMGWADSDWTFTCVDWDAMIEDLTDPAGLCSFAAAGEPWCQAWGVVLLQGY